VRLSISRYDLSLTGDDDSHHPEMKKYLKSCNDLKTTCPIPRARWFLLRVLPLGALLI
jgi:hypothetical protein